MPRSSKTKCKMEGSELPPKKVFFLLIGVVLYWFGLPCIQEKAKLTQRCMDDYIWLRLLVNHTRNDGYLWSGLLHAHLKRDQIHFDPCFVWKSSQRHFNLQNHGKIEIKIRVNLSEIFGYEAITSNTAKEHTVESQVRLRKWSRSSIPNLKPWNTGWNAVEIFGAARKDCFGSLTIQFL